jgi:hypothetical protein
VKLLEIPTQTQSFENLRLIKLEERIEALDISIAIYAEDFDFGVGLKELMKSGLEEEFLIEDMNGCEGRA